ncbi:MAG: hypothetical protein AAFO96_26865 [Bacteroidota bacterium]
MKIKQGITGWGSVSLLLVLILSCVGCSVFRHYIVVNIDFRDAASERNFRGFCFDAQDVKLLLRKVGGVRSNRYGIPTLSVQAITTSKDYCVGLYECTISPSPFPGVKVYKFLQTGRGITFFNEKNHSKNDLEINVFKSEYSDLFEKDSLLKIERIFLSGNDIWFDGMMHPLPFD